MDKPPETLDYATPAKRRAFLTWGDWVFIAFVIAVVCFIIMLICFPSINRA